MIRDLMLESVERRFGTAHTPQPIQWLSDNGSAYRAYETIDFAIRLGLGASVSVSGVSVAVMPPAADS